MNPGHSKCLYCICRVCNVVQLVFCRGCSPATLAERVTGLLADHLEPGETFSQHNLGGISSATPTTVASSQADWDNEPTKQVKLSQLAQFWERKEVHRAIETLNDKYKVVVDQKYAIPTRQALFKHAFKLDFFAAVPLLPGLSVVLPPRNVNAGLSWSFQMDLRRPARPFNFKHGKLGFNPERAVTYVGRHNDLDLWAVFVKEASLSPDAKTEPAGSTFPSNTTLSSKHLRMFQSWLLYLLSNTFFPGIFCIESRRYNINLDGQPPNWSFAVGFELV